MSFDNLSLQNLGGQTPQPEVSFLFCDNIAHDNANQSIINEISFERPVKIQQIRIIKGGSLITPRFKSGFNTSLTQTESIKNFEIYAKDFLNPSAKYATIVAVNNLKELNTNDAIFTIPREVLTNHLVIRGVFKMITLMIYGESKEVSIPSSSNHKDQEYQLYDVPLESLTTDNEKYEKSKTRDNEQVSVEILPHINSMLNYFKSINEMVRLPNIAIVTDNIRPQLLFEESANRQYDDDIVQIIESYTRELNKVITGIEKVDQSGKYLQKLDQLTNHLDKFLKQNDALSKVPADFSENSHIYQRIPLSIVKICLETFSFKYDDMSEAYHGLELAKMILNSADHASDFIQEEGLEKIYSLISEKDGYTSPYIKILALEVLNTCLGYDFACNRFLNFDLSKLESIAAQPETGKEKDGKEKKKRSRSREKSGSRSSSKRSKKKKQYNDKDKKSKKDRSRSRTKSPSRGKKKSSKHKKKRDSESSSESRSPSRAEKNKPKDEGSDLKLTVKF